MKGCHRTEEVGADPCTDPISIFLSISPPESLPPTNSAIFCLFDRSRSNSLAVLGFSRFRSISPPDLPENTQKEDLFATFRHKWQGDWWGVPKMTENTHRNQTYLTYPRFYVGIIKFPHHNLPSTAIIHFLPRGFISILGPILPDITKLPPVKGCFA